VFPVQLQNASHLTNEISVGDDVVALREADSFPYSLPVAALYERRMILALNIKCRCRSCIVGGSAAPPGDVDRHSLRRIIFSIEVAAATTARSTDLTLRAEGNRLGHR
jgi:hypothetical protein